MSGNTAPTAIVRVYRPELSAEERERRMELIKQAAANALVAAYGIGTKEKRRCPPAPPQIPKITKKEVSL